MARLADARTILLGLPGIERSVAEQEGMIGELEGEVRRREEVLGALEGGARGGNGGLEHRGGDELRTREERALLESKSCS